MKRKGSGPSDIIVVRVKRPVKDRLQKLANLTGKTLSDMIRDAIDTLLSKDNNKDG